MKVIMSVGGVDKGKEFRHDLHLPDVPVTSYEDWVKAIQDNNNGKIHFESMTFKERSSITPTPDFVRIWTWCASENEEEIKYYDKYYQGVNIDAYRGYVKESKNVNK